MYDMLAGLGKGEEVKEHDVYRDIFAVTKENAEEYYGK